MNKRLAALFFVLILTIFIAACGNQDDSANASEGETITVAHELGETEVPKNPEKVVVFDFGTLDTLDKLGVDITAVPTENLPSYLSKYEADEYENAGTLFEPDFETLSEIDPDLIIISGRTQEAYEELDELAPTIYLGVDTTRYMDSFTENATLLGEIFGKEAEVEEDLAAIDAEMEELNGTVTENGENGLIILTNDGSLSAYGPGSRFGVIHDVFGFAPADEGIEASTHGQSISFEYLVEKDPDYLFVIDRNQVVGGEYSAESTLDNALVNGTKAWENDDVVYLNPDYWYLSGGGLISVSEMVKEIAAGME